MKKKNTKAVFDSVKQHTKSIAYILVGYGVGEIMGNVLKEYKPDAKGVQKMLIKLGAYALTGMVIKSAADYVGGEIDDIFEFVSEVNKEAKESEDTTDEFTEENKNDKT